jgi:hypothetical protein
VLTYQYHRVVVPVVEKDRVTHTFMTSCVDVLSLKSDGVGQQDS